MWAKVKLRLTINPIPGANAALSSQGIFHFKMLF
jgi:hypothetical protein